MERPARWQELVCLLLVLRALPEWPAWQAAVLLAWWSLLKQVVPPRLFLLSLRKRVTPLSLDALAKSHLRAPRNDGMLAVMSVALMQVQQTLPVAV